MTKNEGKNLLQECLGKMTGDTRDIGADIAYKCGTKKSASEYYSDEIGTRVEYINENSTAKYCVKCFIHFELYAAWKRAKEGLSQTYIVYKKDLEEMQHKQDCPYACFAARINNQKIVLWRYSGIFQDLFAHGKLFFGHWEGIITCAPNTDRG